MTASLTPEDQRVETGCKGYEVLRGMSRISYNNAESSSLNVELRWGGTALARELLVPGCGFVSEPGTCTARNGKMQRKVQSEGKSLRSGTKVRYGSKAMQTKYEGVKC